MKALWFALLLGAVSACAETPTGEDTQWIADLGGYTGKSSGGPFGSITLGRGLTKVVTVASALESLDEETEK